MKVILDNNPFTTGKIGLIYYIDTTSCMTMPDAQWLLKKSAVLQCMPFNANLLLLISPHKCQYARIKQLLRNCFFFKRAQNNNFFFQSHSSRALDHAFNER